MIDRCESECAITHLHYNEENDVIVFATENGNVYYCMANHTNSQEMMDMKTLPVGQIQLDHHEEDENGENDGIQLILSKSKPKSKSNNLSKSKSKSKSQPEQAQQAQQIQQTNTTISTARPGKL